MKYLGYIARLTATLAFTLQVTASHAQNAGIEMAGADVVADSSDRQQLLELFLGDAPERLESAEQDLLAAQANHEGAGSGGTATEAEIAALEAKLLEAQAALASVLGEINGMTELFAQLSDEQVQALTRSLNNAVSSGLVLPLDAAMLQRVIDGDYDRQQINALTQGLEQEARFLAKRDRVAALAAERGTGESAGPVKQMAKFEAKAESEKSKFFAKIDEPTDPGLLLDDALAAAAKSAAKDAARAAAQDSAKQVAKREARLLAKAAAKDAVKESGKNAAKKEKDQAN